MIPNQKHHPRLPALTLLPLLLLLTQPTFQTPCNLGCLSCDTASGFCNLCDIQSFYFLDPSTNLCVLNKPSNCLISFSFGRCLVCESNYFPDGQNICRPVGSADISNCQLYFGEGLCAKCEKNYFVSKDARRCVNSKLESKGNCVVFGERACLMCDDGYLVDNVTGACNGKSFFI